MTKSLQDQLLSAGLIDKKKAKKITKETRKVASQKRRTKDQSLSDQQQALAKQNQEKRERDLALNQQRQKSLEKKALAAQIAQLVEHYREQSCSGDIEFNFKHNNKIKKIRLNKLAYDKVSCGTLSVVCLSDRYDLVPRPVADKIREREPSIVVLDNSLTQTSDQKQSDDDYYADFEIPDDLMW